MCPSGRSPRASASDFQPAFDLLDVDRDGKISREDLRTFYGRRVTDGDEDVIGSMISVADSNRDGFVEYEEFEDLLGSWSRAKGGSVMEDVFRVMDRDGDGRVGIEDLRGHMKLAGLAATDDDIRAMIKLGGGDERDGVSYDGLMKILAGPGR